MPKKDSTRREHFGHLLGGFVAMWAATGSSAFGQQPEKKLSDGDLEKRLNSQLETLVRATSEVSDLQGVDIPPVKIKTVKHSKQKYSDIEIEWDDKGKNNKATFVFSRDTLADLDTEGKQRAFVASALAGHVLRLYPERLKDVGLTDFSRETMDGMPDNPTMARSMRNFVLPLRTDELAITIMKADKSVQGGNPAKDYLDMLAVRRNMETVRLADFLEAREEAPPPKEIKNEKDERKAANQARDEVGRLGQIFGQSFDTSGGQFNANVPTDYDRRMSQVEVTHPESIVKAAPAAQKEFNTDWRDAPVNAVDPNNADPNVIRDRGPLINRNPSGRKR